MNKKTITALTADLYDIYDGVKANKIEQARVKVLTSVADKIIQGHKVKLKYKALLFTGAVSKINELE